MAKNNELRLRNWVFSEQFGKSARVSGIEEKYIYVYIDVEKRLVHYANEFPGISLIPNLPYLRFKPVSNEDHLFSWDGKYFYNTAYCIMQMKADNGEGFVEIQMKYLHEFQNFYSAVTDRELDLSEDFVPIV